MLNVPAFSTRDFSAAQHSKLLELHARYSPRAREVLTGRTRVAYILNNRVVVKLPKTSLGIGDNEHEARSYTKLRHEGTRARCRLVGNDIPVLFMQYVRYASPVVLRAKLKAIPEWVYSIDCGQVGFNSFGQLVAYDYGRN